MAGKKKGKKKKKSPFASGKHVTAQKRFFAKKGHMPIAVLRHNLKRIARGIRRNPDATRIDKEVIDRIP